MINNPLDLALEINQRADKLVEPVITKITICCLGKPEYMAIMLAAVERKIMAARHRAQLQAAGILKEQSNDMALSP